MSKFLHILKRPTLWLLFVVCCANFLAMFVVAYEIGGDASRGKVVDGHFYALSGYVHGAPTFLEVSEQTYHFARWHIFSAFLTAVLATVIWQSLSRLGSGQRGESK